MQTLLVPVDGSESAKHGLEYAIKLAKEHGHIQLHLITVHPEPTIYSEIQVYVPKEKMENLQRLRSMDILEPAINMVKASGIPFTSEVLVGNTAPMIVRRAEQLECIGIVMGTRGMGAVGNLLLGSIATKVVHLAEVPVT
jgi:nucleotide-binding universal stress UspA family protein